MSLTTCEQRQYIREMLDMLVRLSPATFDGVCLYCLEEIPAERFANGGAPKFCCSNHRKKYGRSKS